MDARPLQRSTTCKGERMNGLNAVKLIGVRLGNKQWAKLCEASINTNRQKSEIVRSILDHFFENFDVVKPANYWSGIQIVKRIELLNKRTGQTVKHSHDRGNVKQKNSGKV